MIRFPSQNQASPQQGIYKSRIKYHDLNYLVFK